MRKSINGTRLLAILLTLVMALGMLPLATLAESYSPTGGGQPATNDSFVPEHPPVTVRFSAADATGTGFIFMDEALEVFPGVAAHYYFNNGANIAPDEISALDVLVAAHAVVYGNDADAVRAALAVGGGWVSRAFGHAAGNSTTFVNGAQPHDGTLFDANNYNGVTIDLAMISEGDSVEFYFIRDAWWGDIYAWFESGGVRRQELAAVVDVPVSVTVRGYIGAWFGHSIGPIRDANTNPVAGAMIMTMLPGDGGSAAIDDFLGFTGPDGAASLTFDAPGTYHLMALESEGVPLLTPWLVVTVAEEGAALDPETLAVIALIDGIPYPVTLADRAAVSDAKTAYDDLTAEQRQQIDQAIRAKLANAVQRIEDLDAVAPVVGAIDALPAVEDIELGDEDDVRAARDAYDALTPAQKLLVGAAALNRLEAAEARIDELRGLYASLPTMAEIRGILANTAAYQLRTVTNPSVGSTSGEWTVMALARGGFITDGFTEAYLSNLYAWLQANDGALAAPGGNYSEYSRVVIALAALGADPADIFGYNLLAPLAEFENVVRQGPNGAAYALLAMNSNGFGIPALPTGSVFTQATRELLIANLLASQLDDGGWAMFGVSAAADITAIAVQALAPYYGHRTDVTDAVNRALDSLSQAQSATGGFGNAQGTAQVIVALNELGVSLLDPMFVKGAYTLYDGLMAFYIHESGNSGAFAGAGGLANAMATDQSMYALVSLYRALGGANTLYDMSDAQPRDTGGVAPAPVDRSALIAEIARAEALDERDYTPVSWNMLVLALDVAREVRDDEDATQSDILGAVRGLVSAMADLRAPTWGDTRPGTQTVRIRVAFPAGNRTFLALSSFDIREGETAYSLLRRTGLTTLSSGYSVYDGRYVVSINGLAEFDEGPESGWMYRVTRDGSEIFPDFSASLFFLQPGDRVDWLYTRDGGNDIGGGNVTGRAPSGGTIATDDDYEETADFPGVDIPLADLEGWENPFGDVSESDWFYEAVRFVNALGLMGGTGKGFEPNMNLSRAMIVTILWRLEGEPHAGGQLPETNGQEAGEPDAGADGSGSPFSDVADGLWYTDAVLWASANGIVEGYGGGLFGPNDDITREQLASILFRYAQLKGNDTSGRADISRFSDAGNVSGWARDAMSWAVDTRLIQGRTETTLAPGGAATRAEAATTLMRFVNPH